MTATSTTRSIVKWLSHVEFSDTPISSPSYSPCNSRKRLRSPSPDLQPAEVYRVQQHKHPQLQHSVLRGTPGNAINTPSDSNPPSTPSGSKRKKTLLDLTNNVHNVRQNLAKNGMVFNDEDAFDAYAEFKSYILELVGGPRASTMKEESAKVIKRYLHDNATQGETDTFARVVPMVMKDGKNGEMSRKRSAEGEVIRQADTFGDEEGLKRVHDVQFVKNVLPRRLEQVGRKLGITNTKPDWTFGIREPQFPDRSLPDPGRHAEALIGVAPKVQYPWFVLESKGCQCPMPEAENQAIGDGAAMTSAMRQLDILAGYIDENTEATGPDKDNIAFSCCWVPNLANIYVHWFERRAVGCEGDTVYHMNLVRSYLMNDITHISDFRSDSHNILEYGITLSRKQKLRQLYFNIAARHTSSTSTGTSSTVDS